MAISQGPARGRPRDPRIEQAVAEAAIEVFRERGYPDASLIEIARRAKVGTPTLYRRWRSKSALAIELLAARVVDTTVVDSGEIRRDLTDFIRNRIRTFGDPLYVHLLLAVSTMAVINPELRAAGLAAFNSAQRPMLERLELARDRGELPPDADCDLILNLAAGAVAAPLIYTGQNRLEAEAETIVAAVLDGLARPAP
jgi:AcrR family transcriptional regulator